MNLDQSISQAEFAALVGVSEGAVSDWLRQGKLQRGANGRAWVQAYCGHLREQAAGRDPSGQLTSQRARLAREQADRLAMENAKQRGELVPVALIEPRVRALFVGLRQQLLGWSAELPPVLAGLGEREMRAELAKRAHAVLVQLSAWRPPRTAAEAQRQADDEAEDDEADDAEADDGRSADASTEGDGAERDE